ncbi:MAG: carboxypeptidase regulatory-like domain-containing protein [Acidobacteriaceae bacterium]|nr:carboxypeptidase regulatory-like domain-containing protein [Acidobacteriaceae bacterium]
MKTLIACALLVLAPASLAFASIDGVVVNRTSGKPQPNVSIALIKPGQQGMRTIGNTVSDAAGHFSFEKDEPGGGPQLLQANYRGVNYNKLMTPNVPTADVELDVYEATGSPASARIAQRMLVLEPGSARIDVSETVLVENPTNTTYNNSELGGVRFYLPPAANGQVRVNAQGPQGMPLPRPAEKTDESNVFKVDFPIKPGETEFEIAYTLPVAAPFTYHGRLVSIKGMPAGPLRLVAPPGVTLSGNDIQMLGTEPKTQATIYNLKAAENFAVDISGSGSLHSSDAAGPADSSDSPPVTQGEPQIYKHRGWLLALAFSILAVGLLVLFRSSPLGSPYGK